MLIVDGHLDLAMNAVHWNRDLTRPLEAIRRREAAFTDKSDRGRGVVALPEMRRGGVGLCLATQIGHSVAEQNPIPGWHSPEIAWAQTQAQRAWYEAMCEAGEMVQIRTRGDLDRHVDLWKAASPEERARLPVGFVLHLEGADSLLTPAHVERAWEYGLRSIGPAHYGPGRYSPGTGESGPLEPRGRELLRQMETLGIALDLTHLTDEAFDEALERFQGPVWASHHNCRALVPYQRQLTDDQIRRIAERGGVIGAAFDAWMLIPGWERGKTTVETTGVALRHVVDHIDHVCQLLGTSAHSAIGSDLDGGYGKEQCPGDLESIADLVKVADLLRDRGYSEADVEGIMQGNWIGMLRRALPAS
jgi:membrane dipeptidase